MQQKYIFENGIIKLNPAFQTKQTSTLANPKKALAIVSSTNYILQNIEPYGNSH